MLQNRYSKRAGFSNFCTGIYNHQFSRYRKRMGEERKPVMVQSGGWESDRLNNDNHGLVTTNAQ